MSLLEDKYEVQIFTGTFDGDENVLGLDNGMIQVFGSIDDDAANVAAVFPYTFDLTCIGEEVKVLFKDGKGGTADQPDKHDTIYGVYLTGNTKVIETTRDGIDDTADGKKVKIDGVKYECAEVTATTSFTWAVYNYAIESTVTTNTSASGMAANFAALSQEQNGDYVKFICDDNGKIMRAYVISENISFVTAVNSEKVTLSGVGSIKIADNDVYEGIAKYDVVNYIQLFDTDKDEATFIVTAAESVTGNLDGYKNNAAGTATEKLTLDGTTYEAVNKAIIGGVNIDEDTTETVLDEDDINGEFTAYMVGGYVGYVIEGADSQNQYALVTDVNDGKLDSTFDVPKAELLLADGTKVTAELHKDSTIYTNKTTSSTPTYANDSTPLATGVDISTALEVGQLVKYAIVGDTYKITEIGTYNTSVAASTQLYDKDTKEFRGTVTAGDCVLFTLENGTDYKAYNIRNLNDFSTTSSATVGYFTKDGKVVAAYAELGGRPSGASSNMHYGIVSKSLGVVTVDDDYYNKYTVENQGEPVTVLLPTTGANAGTLSKGDIVGFELSVDDIYNASDIDVYTGTTYNHTDGLATWVKEYSASDKTLTYWTNLDSSNKGMSAKTVALDDDCIIAYVNADDDEGGEDAGISAFDGVTGYRNVILVKNDSDSKVIAIIVETSGDVDIMATTPMSVPANASAANIKALADGVYAPTDTSFANDAGNNPSIITIFKFTADAGKYTLTVKQGTNVKGTGEITFSGDGGHFFYANNSDWGTGDFTYTITDGSGNTIDSGSFSL